MSFKECVHDGLFRTTVSRDAAKKSFQVLPPTKEQTYQMFYMSTSASSPAFLRAPRVRFAGVFPRDARD